MSAVVVLFLTVGAGEARRTAASVGSLTGIETGAAVATRLVIRTVVEILFAEKTAPTFVAETVPRFLTRPVKASRVSLALITQATSPSAMTSTEREKQRKQEEKDKFTFFLVIHTYTQTKYYTILY